MMESMGTIREFRTAQFRVIVDAVPDCDLDLSWDDDGGTREGLESGRFISFCARVRVLHDTLGEVGTDYLGGCIYECLEAFDDHRKVKAYERELNAKRRKQHKAKVSIGSYFSDMIRSAISEARKTVSGAQSVYVRAA